MSESELTSAELARLLAAFRKGIGSREPAAWTLDEQGRWTRPLTAREERRYSKRMLHNYQGVRDGRSCNRIFRGFCWRCFWLDITGINRRRRAQYIADFKARADAFLKGADQ